MIFVIRYLAKQECWFMNVVINQNGPIALSLLILQAGLE